MSSRIDLISLSTQPLRLVHESQYVVMLLHPGTVDLSVDGVPTEQFKYLAGDIALVPRQTVGFVQSRDQIKFLRFELSDLRLSEAAVESNREIGFQSIPRLKDLKIRALMTAVNIERESGFPSGQLFLQSVEMALAGILVNTYALSVKTGRSIKGGLSDVGRRNVIDLVRSRISEDISLADMAASTGLSTSRFSRLFKTSVGKSPHRYILQQRVQYAKELLVSSDLRIIDIALTSGFKTQQHFARIFREICGLNPTEYRQLKLRKP